MTDYTMRIRMVKKRIIIYCAVVLFVVGNVLILRPWSWIGDKAAVEAGQNRNWPKHHRIQDLHSETGKDEEEEQNELILNTEHISREEGKEIKVKEKEQGHEVAKMKNSGDPKVESFKYHIAVLIIACNRPSVARCIDQILKQKPKDIEIPVIVSQDCGHPDTEAVIKSYEPRVKLIKQPDLTNVAGVPPHMTAFMGYYKIARHFKFALTQAFKDSAIDSVIIVEDDIDIAPDFFEYFLGTRALLDRDESLWCVSAWNDNGREGFVKGNSLLYRSDFFPGLGWMITRKVWQELEPKWPIGFWDDWMREPKQRKERACIRPEISRTKTFGRIGVSNGQFYDQYLKYIQLNNEFYPFRSSDLSYLLKSNYDRTYFNDVRSKPIVTLNSVLSGSIHGEAARIRYSSELDVQMLTGQFGLMTDIKAGTPRTAYNGIISFMREGKRIFLTPDWLDKIQ